MLLQMDVRCLRTLDLFGFQKQNCGLIPRCPVGEWVRHFKATLGKLHLNYLACNSESSVAVLWNLKHYRRQGKPGKQVSKIHRCRVGSQTAEIVLVGRSGNLGRLSTPTGKFSRRT